MYVFILFKKRLEDLDLEKELETQKNNLANLEAILSAQEKERKRIADDLHDEVGATLSLVQKNLIYIKKNQQNIQNYESELSQSIELVDSSIQSIRNISKELIPSQVIQLGIVKAIKQHIELVENPFFTDCVFVTNIDKEIEIEQDHAIDIYRIYLELVTNIIKHSNTTKIIVECNVFNNNLIVSVLHNGIGLTDEEYEGRQLISQGLGLKSLSNRVKRIGATINFEEKKNQFLVELKYHLKKQ